jgi:hypothetical protein
MSLPVKRSSMTVHCRSEPRLLSVCLSMTSIEVNMYQERPVSLEASIQVSRCLVRSCTGLRTTIRGSTRGNHAVSGRGCHWVAFSVRRTVDQ